MIGRRKGAILAIEKCGLKPVIIDVLPRSEQAHNAFGGTAQWALDKASELFPDAPPIGVAAVATGSVIAAAVIREQFGLPGISRHTALRCHDKLVMKHAITNANIPCAPWQKTTANTTTEELIDSLRLPLVLKMPISSGGRGVWICKTPAEVTTHLQPNLLAESFVLGTEMSLETFRHNGNTIFQNTTNYLKPRWANVVPDSLDPDTLTLVSDLNQRVHNALDIFTGISHMEIFLTKDGPVFGEIAARPPGGFIMDLLHRAYNFDPWDTLIRLAIGQHPSPPTTPQQFAGVWLIHPGHGTISSVTGKDNALKIPGITKITCNLKPGDHIDSRIGSGEIKGKIIAQAHSLHACSTALKQAIDTIQIDLSPTPTPC